jgi:hypothetical protein
MLANDTKMYLTSIIFIITQKNSSSDVPYEKSYGKLHNNSNLMDSLS